MEVQNGASAQERFCALFLDLIVAQENNQDLITHYGPSIRKVQVVIQRQQAKSSKSFHVKIMMLFNEPESNDDHSKSQACNFMNDYVRKASEQYLSSWTSRTCFQAVLFQDAMPFADRSRMKGKEETSHVDQYIRDSHVALLSFELINSSNHKVRAFIDGSKKLLVEQCSENVSCCISGQSFDYNVKFKGLSLSYVTEFHEEDIQNLERFFLSASWLLPSFHSSGTAQFPSVQIRFNSIHSIPNRVIVVPGVNSRTKRERFEIFREHYSKLLHRPVLCTEFTHIDPSKVSVGIILFGDAGTEKATKCKGVVPLQIICTSKGKLIDKSDYLFANSFTELTHACKRWSYILGLTYVPDEIGVGGDEYLKPHANIIGYFKNHMENELSLLTIIIDYSSPDGMMAETGFIKSIVETLFLAIHKQIPKLLPTKYHAQQFLVQDVYFPEMISACASIISRSSRLVQARHLQVIQNVYGEESVHNPDANERFTRIRLQELMSQCPKEEKWNPE